MKQCPNCWEPMALTAIRCPHCGNGEPIAQGPEKRGRPLLWLSSVLALAFAVLLLRYLEIL